MSGALKAGSIISLVVIMVLFAILSWKPSEAGKAQKDIPKCPETQEKIVKVGEHVFAVPRKYGVNLKKDEVAVSLERGA